MFDQDDSDEYESGEEEMEVEAGLIGVEGGSSGGIFGLNRDPTTSLRAQLEELDDQDTTDHDGDSHIDAEGHSPFGTNSTIRAAADGSHPAIISPLTEPTSTGSPLIPTPDILLAHSRPPPASSLSGQTPPPETSSSDVVVNGISNPGAGTNSSANTDPKKAAAS